MAKNVSEPAVAKYLSDVGVRWPTNRDTFRRQMRERYGDGALDRVHAALGPEGESTPAFYALKNQSLRLSLDVSFQNDGNFYAQYLSGVVAEHRNTQPAPAKVLDIGCDCGLLTCFYAQYFPEADVLGIDLSEPAIKNARQLATQLKLPNVRFEVADLRKLDEVPLPRSDFDLITCMFVLNDALGFPRVPVTGPREWASLPPTDMWSRTVTGIAELLSPAGIAFSVERVTNPRAMAWWIRALSEGGLRVVWNRSAPLAHDSVYGSEDGKLHRTWLPVLTCVHGPVGLPQLPPETERLLGTWT